MSFISDFYAETKLKKMNEIKLSGTQKNLGQALYEGLAGRQRGAGAGIQRGSFVSGCATGGFFNVLKSFSFHELADYCAGSFKQYFEIKPE